MIKLRDLLHNDYTSIQECVITHTVLNNKVILAKNRDRAYNPTISIVRDLIDGLEIVYMQDNDTDWSEGMNSNGIGIVNSALMVTADENEKKLIKKKGKPGPDGGKIRTALSLATLQLAIQSITNYKGIGKYSLMGHTFICTPEESFSIEVTSKHLPVIKRLNRKLNHVRTNHGYDYPDSGYTTGPNKESSKSRWRIAQHVLDTAKNPSEILNGLSSYYPINMRNNPYRDADKVINPTDKDILSTSTQVLMNLNDLIFNVRVDKTNCIYTGIDDKTPDGYTPKIKIKCTYVQNTTVDDLDLQFKEVDENFRDGTIKGKSSPGRVKRAGATCKGSVTNLRAKAKTYGGEKGKMYHWCANMKSGNNK
jgi:hypothetical protein